MNAPGSERESQIAAKGLHMPGCRCALCVEFSHAESRDAASAPLLRGLVLLLLTVVVVGGSLDLFDWMVGAPTFNPFHPHPPAWSQPSLRHTIPLHKVCLVGYGYGCFYNTGASPTRYAHIRLNKRTAIVNGKGTP